MAIMSGAFKRPAAAASVSVAKSRRKTASALEGGVLENDAESAVRGIDERIRVALCDWPVSLGMNEKESLLRIYAEFCRLTTKVFSCGGPVIINAYAR